MWPDIRPVCFPNIWPGWQVKLASGCIQDAKKMPDTRIAGQTLINSLLGSLLQRTMKTDNEVHISLEDQQKINKFARSNQRMEELKEELQVLVY